MTTGASPAEPPGPLAHIPLFGRLGAAEQAALFAAMRLESVAAHQAVFWLGEKGDTFYLINSGKVAITVPNESGEHVVLNYLGPGGFFGEISLLDGGPRTATVRAVEPTELYVLSRADFHAFLRQRPDVAIEVLTIMGQRQRASTEMLRAMKNPNVAFEESHQTLWQRISERVSTLAAGPGFLIFHIVWFTVWVVWNMLGGRVIPRNLVFDEYPFGMLTLMVSLEAIFLSIFVMVTQNRQAEKDRLRIDLDYQINLRAHTEIMSLARRLDVIEEHLIGERAAPPPLPPPVAPH